MNMFCKDLYWNLDNSSLIQEIQCKNNYAKIMQNNVQNAKIIYNYVYNAYNAK